MPKERPSWFGRRCGKIFAERRECREKKGSDVTRGRDGADPDGGNLGETTTQKDPDGKRVRVEGRQPNSFD